MLAEDFPDAAVLGQNLREAGWTIAVAESCTGGLLGAVLTAVPGASDYVRGGVIAYADDVKQELVGVDQEILAGAGAVSEPVSAQMAEGARRRLQADVGVGITGVAGPGQPGEAKPAGLVFVAVASPVGLEVSRLQGDAGRETNRAAAVREALRVCIAHTGRRP